MKYYVYVLFSQRDKKLYIGSTNNLKKRFTDHANGLVIATKYRRPLTLIFDEFFYNELDAKSQEEYLKSGHGRKHLKQMLKNTLRTHGYRYQKVADPAVLDRKR